MPSEHRQQPLVSIGIPTYNRPDGLRKTLSYVTGQTYRNLEILVSNNASPDPETEQIIKSFANADPRIKYHRQERNIGAGANFQFVMRQATGKYFAWFADDDSCEPDFVEALVECLESDDDIALAMCSVRFVDEVTSRESTMDLQPIALARSVQDWPTVRKLFFAYPTSHVFICIYGLYRTAVLKQCKRLDFTSRWKKLVFGSEVPFLAQIATRGKIVSIPSVLKTYRSHARSEYVMEHAKVRSVDNIIRNTELRMNITRIALRSQLPLTDRLALGLHPWPSSLLGAGRLMKAGLRSLLPR
jgi:glycosyltransferase involved in cell wall biosynthesis